MAITLALKSATETLDLNDLFVNGTGAQVIAGLTGFGLPPVNVFYATGAGDGAVYRGRQVQPRDVDLPLHFVATSRTDLKSRVAKLARILDGEATLEATDGSEVKYLKVVRVGGGDFTYGPDTDGEFELDVTVTVRAGNPFWTSSSTTTVTQTGTGIGPTMSLTNNGTLPANPVWTITGPGENLVITAPNGEILSWRARLTDGEVLTINSAAGTITDATGTSRYASLDAAPRFSTIPIGTNNFTLSFPAYSASVSRTNLSTNPSLETNANGYTVVGGASGVRQASGGFVGSSCYLVTTTNAINNQNVVTFTNNGTKYAVSPNTTYTHSVYMKLASGGAVSGAGASVWAKAICYDSGGAGLGLTSGSTTVVNLASGYVRVSVTFTTPSNAASVNLYAQFDSYTLPGGGYFTLGSTFLVDGHLFEVGSTPQSYFDGATTSTGTKAYAWTGTANASTSTLTSTPIRANAIASVNYATRDWLEV